MSKQIQPKETNPANNLAGRLIYHAYSQYGDGSSELFMFDFRRRVLTKFDLSKYGIVDPMNGVFSPDGKHIAFMGREDGHWHVFALAINANATPKNLTKQFGLDARNEDPKFSSDGKNIIFKRNGAIASVRIISSSQEIKVKPKLNIIAQSDGVEFSMPSLSPSGKYVVFTQGANASFEICRAELGSGMKPVGAPSTHQATQDISDYYPIYRDSTSYYFSRWISADNHTDQLYLKIIPTGEAINLPINDPDANNSDACPVDDDLLIFSSTITADHYELFVGNIATGEVWSLSDFGINIGDNQKLGANYITF